MPSWRNLCSLLTTVPGRCAFKICYLLLYFEHHNTLQALSVGLVGR